MNLDLRHPYAFVVLVTEVSGIRISEFLSSQKCLRYPKSTDKLALNIKKKNAALLGQTKGPLNPMSYIQLCIIPPSLPKNRC